MDVGSSSDYSARQREKWRELASTWTETGPPASPSQNDIDAFGYFLQQNTFEHTHPMAVLGCTPALRRLVRKTHHGDYYCIDFVPEMYEAASAALDSDARELYVQGNWLEIPSLQLPALSAIMGDKSLDNVEFEQWPRFFDSTSKAMIPGAQLILHVAVPNTELAGADPIALVGRWSDRFIANECSLEDAASGLWEDLLSCSARPEHRVLSLGSFELALRTSHLGSNEQLVVDKFISLFGNTFSGVWTRFDLSDLEEIADPFFEDMDVRYSADYHAATDQPIICLRRR